MNIWPCRKVLPDSVLIMMKWLTQCALKLIAVPAKDFEAHFCRGCCTS